MHRPAIDDAIIEAVAADTAFDSTDVKIGLRTLHDAVRDRLAEEFAAARDPERPDHLLLDGPDATWFAFGVRELESALEAAGYEMDDDLLAVAAATNLRALQTEKERTVSFATEPAETDDAPMRYPVRVNKPESWQAAGIRALETVVDLLDADISPTAALDAWAVESMGVPAANWAERRGVDEATVHEAVERARAYRETPGGRVSPADDVIAPPTDAVSTETVDGSARDRVVVPTGEGVPVSLNGDSLDGGSAVVDETDEDKNGAAAAVTDSETTDNGGGGVALADIAESGDWDFDDAVAASDDGDAAGGGDTPDGDSATDGGVADDDDVAASVPEELVDDIDDETGSTGET